MNLIGGIYHKNLNFFGESTDRGGDGDGATLVGGIEDTVYYLASTALVEDMGIHWRKIAVEQLRGEFYRVSRQDDIGRCTEVEVVADACGVIPYEQQQVIAHLALHFVTGRVDDLCAVRTR